MIQGNYEFIINHPIKTVFNFFNTPSAEPIWSNAIEQVSMRPDGTQDVTYSFLGKKAHFHLNIEARHYTWRCFSVIDGPFHIKGIFEYEALSENQTKMDIHFEMDPGKFFGIIPRFLIKKSLDLEFKKSGRDFTGTIEKNKGIIIHPEIAAFSM